MPAQLVGVQMSLGMSSFVSYKVRLLLAVTDVKPTKFVMYCSHFRNVIVADNFFCEIIPRFQIIERNLYMFVNYPLIFN